MTQSTNNHPGEPTCRPMIEETMKIPEPIIDPATSIVESSKPSPRTNFWSAAGGEVVEVSTGLKRARSRRELILPDGIGQRQKQSLSQIYVMGSRIRFRIWGKMLSSGP